MTLRAFIAAGEVAVEFLGLGCRHRGVAPRAGTRYAFTVFSAALFPETRLHDVARLRSRLLLGLGALGIVFSAASCQSFKAVAQCNQLLGTVNNSLTSAQELHAKPPSAENYKALSDIFGQLEGLIVEQTKGDGEFERSAKGYAKQMRRVSRETRNFSQALERLEKAKQAADADQEKLAREELARIRERAGRLVEASANDAKKFREACRPKG